MRNSYLESYYNLIPKIQQDRLLEVLKDQYDKAGESPDDATLQKRLESLITELSEPLGSPQVRYREARKYGKVSSQNYNNTMEEVYVDLGALFKQDNLINKTIKNHENLNDAILKDVRASLRRVENDVFVYKVIKENKTGITDAVYNSFYKDTNETEHTIFKAWNDTDVNSIKLPPGIDHSALSINGLAMAEIKLVHYGGGIKGTLESEEHRKDKAIDENMETFWGEVILTDEPIRQTYDGNTEFGAICEVIIKLFRAELINHIKFNPFTNYPLRIFKIEYKDMESGSWQEVDITEKTSSKAMEFNFNEVKAKEIKVVINQQNPSINTYKLPRRVINNVEMWQQIVDREHSISTATEAPIQATQDMIDYITGWQAYVDASKEYKDKVKKIGRPKNYNNTESMSETIFDATTDEITKTSEKGADELKLDLYGEKGYKKEDLIEVRKYEYVYGSYNIDVKRLWYLEKGEYISPKYESNGIIIEARLDVNEVAPSGTAIEYAIATRDNKWKNILPSGGYITKERLDIDPLNKTGILRFPTSEINVLYRNNDPMTASDYTYDPSTMEVTLESGWYTASAAFAASYLPTGVSDVTPSGVVVSFADDSLIESDEEYIGEDSRQYKIELNHYPYTKWSIINDTSKAGASSPNFTYESGRWLNSSSSSHYGIDSGEYYDPLVVTVDGHDAENRTDYYDNENPALTSYETNGYPYFEYLHVGKNLYFNIPLQDREIKVDYYYLNDYIQFKALLRSNDRSNVTKTPILEDYTLKLRTI